MNSEVARLAVAEERLRFSRDLHDILGHSLTVITVKAELAGRLLDVDPVRAATEVADVEWLSRDALAQVRGAVSGYRDVTLPAEIASARSALEAAGIEPVLPAAVDDVPAERRELFGWAVREGVTNVVRHSGARRCRVSLTAGAVEVADDGGGQAAGSGGAGAAAGLSEGAPAAGSSSGARAAGSSEGAPAAGPSSGARAAGSSAGALAAAVYDGGPHGHGHGLAGLAERAAAAGGRLVVGRAPEGGFLLRVQVP
jgi:two-component system sensor histidine kinase DesK